MICILYYIALNRDEEAVILRTFEFQVISAKVFTTPGCSHIMLEVFQPRVRRYFEELLVRDVSQGGNFVNGVLPTWH